MPNFIRLAKMVINTRKINTIDILPTKYIMYLNNKNVEGWFFGFAGTIESNENTVEICKHNHPDDYKIVEKWINQINLAKEPEHKTE